VRRGGAVSRIRCIVSGGQTGVDRAALDVALGLGLPCGGWCPKGRKAEDGPIPRRYPLFETPTAAYRQRTEWNVRDTDGTLVLCWGRATGGTALTIRLARRRRRPLLVLDLTLDPSPSRVRDWVRDRRIRVLNVAGPRESKSAGVHRRAVRFLRAVLTSNRGRGSSAASPDSPPAVSSPRP
jgi:hypothetical protein